MNRSKDMVKKMSTVLASKMMKRDAGEWPPVCMMFAYQPVHPAAKQAAENEEILKKANDFE